MLTTRIYLSFKIFLYHKRAYRHTERGTETGIFNIYGYCDPGIVIRRESHEYGMVTAMWILGCSRFSAYIQARYVGKPARTAQYRHAHTFGNILVILFLDMRLMPHAVFLINRAVCNLLDHMRCMEPAPVRDCRAEIGYLQRSRKNFSLTDRNGNY